VPPVTNAPITQAARDPVLRALGGLATGAAAGAAVVTAGVLALRTFQRGRVAETQQEGFTLLAVTVVIATVVAAGTGWVLSGGIVEAWRRGVIATLAVFGTVMLSLVAVPADLLAGRGGLAGYLALLIGVAAWALVRARRAA
jgi:hypothetical protein